VGIFPDDYSVNNNSDTSAVTTANTTSTPMLLKEYAIDFETGEPLLDQNNKFIIVEGIEAVQVRCWLALRIQRSRYLMYMDVGNNLKSLVGKDLAYINKNIQSILNEALVDNEYVTAAENIQVTQDGSKVTVEFIINSIYGSYNSYESLVI